MIKGITFWFEYENGKLKFFNKVYNSKLSILFSNKINSTSSYKRIWINWKRQKFSELETKYKIFIFFLWKQKILLNAIFNKILFNNKGNDYRFSMADKLYIFPLKNLGVCKNVCITNRF